MNTRIARSAKVRRVGHDAIVCLQFIDTCDDVVIARCASKSLKQIVTLALAKGNATANPWMIYSEVR